MIYIDNNLFSNKNFSKSELAIFIWDNLSAETFYIYYEDNALKAIKASKEEILYNFPSAKLINEQEILNGR